jgi:hypothetical protein
MERHKIYALKTTENNSEKYSGRPFITTNGYIYQMLRDLDITFEVRPNNLYQITLIELENISRSYSLDRTNHINIHTFNLFVDPTIVQQLNYGEYANISDSTYIDGKLFEIKFIIQCRKNYDYDINYMTETTQSDNIISESDPNQLNLTPTNTNNEQEHNANSQTQHSNMNWANDKTYLMTLPTLIIS